MQRSRPSLFHSAAASVLSALAIGALGGCSAAAGVGTTPNVAHATAGVRAPAARRRATTPIDHVVIVIQENRSFDNLFQGYPGANTQSYGLDSQGNDVPLKPVGFTGKVPSVIHTLRGFLGDYDNGNLDGWDTVTKKDAAYSYVPAAQVQPYLVMARQYVLADEMFASNIDASFVAHQYLIAGQSNDEVDFPQGAWGCNSHGKTDLIYQLTAQRTYGAQVPVCQNPQTLGDELDSAGVSWHFYAAATMGSIWSAYQAVSHIYNGPDWTSDVVTPSSQFLADVSNPSKPYLANVTWITPTFTNSDHQGSKSATGPTWVASVVNAVGQSQFWDSTVIFVVWDDWGGWYDHVPPPQLDLDGLGFRVPLLCISPYAQQGVVNHTQLEFGSILRFVENNWSLGQLAASDSRATPADTGCLNYSQAPRTFVPIASVHPASFFLRQPQSAQPPDDD